MGGGGTKGNSCRPAVLPGCGVDGWFYEPYGGRDGLSFLVDGRGCTRFGWVACYLDVTVMESMLGVSFIQDHDDRAMRLPGWGSSVC